MMERQLGDAVLAWALFFCTLTQVYGQLCRGPCYCPRLTPRCPAGVPLVLDGCHCCQVCARQQGEACDDKYLCDNQRGLQCDYSASYPGGPGECVSREELGCELNGVTYQEGQVFQLSCAVQCRCAGGGVTCVPQCSEDVLLPSVDCPQPQRVQLPGKCCREWVCENMENSIFQDALAAYRPDGTGLDLTGQSQTPLSNCIEQSTEWSSCSRSCGLGVSSRVSNQNRACRLERQSRQCQVRPCQGLFRRVPVGVNRCEPSYKAALPMRLEHQGCYSVQYYRPRYCGLCSDGRCCTPHRTRTVQVTFRCPRGRLLRRSIMAIDSCACHHRCPHTSVATPRSPMAQA